MNNKAGYSFLPHISVTGTFATTGYRSALQDLSAFSVININIACTQDITLKINNSPTLSEVDKAVYFEKSIPANQVFHRRFANISQFLQIEIINDNAVAGSIVSMISGSKHTQFNASTFLNSKIGIDDGTNLIRVGNDYNLDMVREIHEDFKKVNIQGITDQQHGVEFTLGNGSTDLFSNGNAATAFYILTTNAADVTGGTGARYIKIDYIDSNYDEQTFTKQLGWVAGSIPIGVTGYAILRAEVTQTGSSYKNLGVIQITDILNTLIFATIDPEANVSHGGAYLIPRNRELIVTDCQISAVGYPGTLRIYEYDFSDTRIRASIGDFRLSTSNLAQTFRLNGKIAEKKMIMVNVIPDVGAPASTTNICININAVLCPLINSFPA